MINLERVTCSAHTTTRNLVERGIGQLKRRFHVLHGEVRFSPEKTCQVVTCCAILHNICKDRNIEIPDDDGQEDFRDNGNDAEGAFGDGGPPDEHHNVPENGLQYRQHIARECFPWDGTWCTHTPRSISYTYDIFTSSLHNPSGNYDNLLILWPQKKCWHALFSVSANQTTLSITQWKLTQASWNI